MCVIRIIVINCLKMWTIVVLIFILTGARSASVKHVLYGSNNNMEHLQQHAQSNSATNSNSNKNNCNDMSNGELRQVLGPAYNPRYMSINEPFVTNQQSSSLDNLSLKRTIVDYSLDFYVDDHYQNVESETAAWDVKYYEVINSDDTTRKYRSPRATSSKKDMSFFTSGSSSSALKKPWECESRIRWLDLGREYFPRYLRTVECLAHDCWYGHYTCKPRSFTVKILRKRNGNCAPLFKSGQSGLPNELKQLWIWEERAVNFCCDCAA